MEGEVPFAPEEGVVLLGVLLGIAELVIEVGEDARGFGVEGGVDFMQLIEPLAAQGFIGGGWEEIGDQLATEEEEFGDIGVEGGEGVDDELGIVLGVVAAGAEGGDVFGDVGLA